MYISNKVLRNKGCIELLLIRLFNSPEHVDQFLEIYYDLSFLLKIECFTIEWLNQ